MSTIFSRWFARGKSRIERRLDKKNLTFGFEPRLAARNFHYEVSDKIGGIGAMHLLVRGYGGYGLVEAINRRLLIVPLANTREVLSIVNRPGNRPSH